jgi:hypothetical protein
MDTTPINKPRVVPPLNAPRVVAPINPPVVHAPLFGQSGTPAPEESMSLSDYGAVAGLAAVGVAAWGIQRVMEQGEFTDNSPSTVIDHASWDSLSMELTVVTHSGRSYSYPCGPAEWAAYVSAPSKGGYMNETYWG